MKNTLLGIDNEVSKLKFKYLYRDAFTVALSEIFNHPIYVLKKSTSPTLASYSRTFVKVDDMYMDIDGLHTYEDIVTSHTLSYTTNSTLVPVEHEVMFDMHYDFYDVEDAIAFITQNTSMYTLKRC
jgi:hypothetical protein